ncbi:MAG: hypothetical protein WA125_17440 [Desulfosporosinus sp.]
MEVSGDSVIDKLLNQIKEMAKVVAVRDAQIELLQQQVAKLNTKE